MKRGMFAASAAATLALVATPALVGTASAAPNDHTSPAAEAEGGAEAQVGKVEEGPWNSYVVVMKADPLVKSFEPDELDSSSARKAETRIDDSHDAVLEEAGISTSKKTYDYSAVINGFAARVSHEQAEKLAGDPKVLAVVPDVMRQAQELTNASDEEPDTADRHGRPAKGGSGKASGSDQIKDAKGESLQDFLGLDGELKGDGELLGVIDTGIWPEHPSFADDGSYPDAPELAGDSCDFGNIAANPEDAAFECNDKLVGARQMLDTYRALLPLSPDEFDSARDDDGHGTHTASTAAGNADVRAWIYDEDRSVDRTSGVAPRAQVIAYKALGQQGGFSSDLAAAIDQAVEDAVDVINYSIGGGPGLTSADAISFLFANDAGVHVATSAGNSGPGDSTIGGPADLPWITTVGASTQPRFYAGKVRLWAGDSRRYVDVKGSSVTLTSGKLRLVDAEALGNPLCLNQDQLAEAYVADGDSQGEADRKAARTWKRFAVKAKKRMVLCWRGEIGRAEKGLHVLEAGGKAMVLSNQNDVDNYFTDNFLIPTVMVDKTEGDIVAEYAAKRRSKAQIIDTANIDTFTPAPSMAFFSSRGPNPSAPSIIKPDITAPGVQVLAGASPDTYDESSAQGQLFQAIAGTSMSSPVVAGMFLLADEAHPDWTPAEVKSSLMTTAYQEVVDNDRSTPAQPFDFGSGHVASPGTFTNPGLVYDAGFLDFLAFYCATEPGFVSSEDCEYLVDNGYPTTVEDLNYPTIGISSLAGSKTVTRTVTNVSGGAATFTASVENPAGMEISVEPASLPLADGESASFEVTVTNTGAPVNTDWSFGAVTWEGAGATVRSNVAAYATPFEAPDEVQGSGADGSVAIPVQVGYDGTYVPEPAGLAGNEPLTGTVTQDPDQTFAGCQDQPGTVAEPLTVSNDTAYLRLSLVIPGADDIDLFLCHGGSVVGSSTSGGTDELIELSHPEAGDYTLYVHGWSVPSQPLDFSVGRWQAVLGQGGLTVDPTSVEVTRNEVVEVTASWTDAPEGVSYGVVDHTQGGGEAQGQTVVEVTNTDTATG